MYTVFANAAGVKQSSSFVIVAILVRHVVLLLAMTMKRLSLRLHCNNKIRLCDRRRREAIQYNRFNEENQLSFTSDWCYCQVATALSGFAMMALLCQFFWIATSACGFLARTTQAQDVDDAFS